MTYAKPLPRMTADTKDFWEGCRNHEFRIQTCGDCGRLRLPWSFLCPACLSPNAGWIRASGRGTIYSYVVYHVAYDPAFRNDLPYIVALVTLEEGPRFLTNIVDCDHSAVACDMAVEIVWDDVTETVTLPRFRPGGHT